MSAPDLSRFPPRLWSDADVIERRLRLAEARAEARHQEWWFKQSFERDKEPEPEKPSEP